MYEVRLKPGHPTGSYRRGGEVFSTGEVKYFEEVPEVIANDPLLEVTEEAEAEKRDEEDAKQKAAAKAAAKEKAKKQSKGGKKSEQV